MNRETRDIVRILTQHPQHAYALASLVQVHGSSYRCPGARMLISETGRTAGSLSAGCLEDEIAEQAFRVLTTSQPTWLEFDTRRRFGCEGSIEILVERARPEFLAGWVHHYQARHSGLIATRYGREAAEPGSRFMEPETGDGEGPDILLQPFIPPLQLLLIGSGPDDAALRDFAAALGWVVRSFASAHELTGPFDAWTAAVIKTHNYGRDFAALRTLLPLDLPYLGLVGSRRRREQLLGDLYDTGMAAGENLFAPAGLDLGGEAPEVIALAIIAEIQAVFAQGSRQHWRERHARIHATAHPACAPPTATSTA